MGQERLGLAEKEHQKPESACVEGVEFGTLVAPPSTPHAEAAQPLSMCPRVLNIANYTPSGIQGQGPYPKVHMSFSVIYILIVSGVGVQIFDRASLGKSQWPTLGSSPNTSRQSRGAEPPCDGSCLARLIGNRPNPSVDSAGLAKRCMHVGVLLFVV